MAQIDFYDLFMQGFCGSALTVFVLVALISGVLISIIFLRKNQKDISIKDTVVWSIIIPFICSTLFIFISIFREKKPDGAVFIVLLYILIGFFPWIFYFTAIPQLAIFIINKALLKYVAGKRKLFSMKIVWLIIRITLSIIFLFALVSLHSYIGITFLDLRLC